MKQMTLIEMDGFLKGKCIPRDLKVNETNAEYLVRKFAEIESKLETALRECRSAGITIDNLEAKCAALAADNKKAMEAIKQADAAVKLAHEKFSALTAENAMLKQRTQQLIDIISNTDNDYCMCGSAMKDHVHSGCGYPTGMFDYYYNQWLESDNKTPATDAFLAEVRASAIPDEATERDLFEEWVMEKIFISKTTLEGLRTDDGYRNSTLSGTDYNGMWSQWKAIRAAQLRQEAAQ
ncbi:hypothetical protein ACN671_004277 [Escherichia coli]|nr:hypothetical protein [Escherichia coli]MCV2046094.1 hypothetical protein [Escherichia coli]OYB86224.1 hypothetical protein RX21_04442 [Escherichia coli]OYB95833.1 hypothetical protein RX19_03992 [Escherichia coli]